MSYTCDNRRRQSIHLNSLLRVSHCLLKVKIISINPKTEDVAFHDRRAHVKAAISHSVLMDTSRVQFRVIVVANGRNHAWSSIRTTTISDEKSNCFDWGCWGEGDLPPGIGITSRNMVWMNHIREVRIIIYRGICCRHIDVCPITSASCWRTRHVPPIRVSHFWQDICV